MSHDYGSSITISGDWHVSGQIHNNDIDLHYLGQINHILVEFKSLGAYQLFNIKGSDTVNLYQQPIQVNSKVDDFCRQVSTKSKGLDITDINTRVDNITTALSECALHPFDVPTYLVTCVDELDKSNGTLKIRDLAASINMSTRQINRKFTEYVGIPPKFYTKVLQMNQALQAMATNNQTCLTEVAQATGFYDQSHLISVMQDFFSKPPIEFINSNEEILMTFLARSRDIELKFQNQYLY